MKSGFSDALFHGRYYFFCVKIPKNQDYRTQNIVCQEYRSKKRKNRLGAFAGFCYLDSIELLLSGPKESFL
jgi:hypothetical protein